MSTYKEFLYKDDDPDDWFTERYSVLQTEFQFTSDGPDPIWIVNAHEPGSAFRIYKGEVDRYLEILNWIKEQEANS